MIQLHPIAFPRAAVNCRASVEKTMVQHGAPCARAPEAFE